MNGLESYRRREFRGVEELTSAAAMLVERFSPEEPLRGNVRLGITERTVRHYLSEDLLGPPVGQSGTSLIFNYGNLLRLLAVKKLLAEHWSVIKIKEFMTALDLTALEQLVGGTLGQGEPQARSQHKRAESDEPYGRASGLRESQRETTATDLDRASSPPPLASLAVESARRAERASVEWIELAPGLEIKVRGSFRPPLTEEERERLVTRFWSVINRARMKAEG